MVSVTAVLEERSVGQPKPVTYSKQRTRCSVLLVLEGSRAGLQKCLLAQSRDSDSYLNEGMKAKTGAKVRVVTVSMSPVNEACDS